MTPGLASVTQHRPAHLLLGQCSLPVTFRMVVPIFPMVRPPGSGWISCHNLHWGSTTKCTRGCEGRGGRLRLRLDSTTNSTQGFDGPRSCPATLQAPLSHIVVLPSSTYTLSGGMSASVGCCGGSGYGWSTDADLSSSKPWETVHKQGVQGRDRIHQNNSIQPLTS